jgi:hypothetical protein
MAIELDEGEDGSYTPDPGQKIVRRERYLTWQVVEAAIKWDNRPSGKRLTKASKFYLYLTREQRMNVLYCYHVMCPEMCDALRAQYAAGGELGGAPEGFEAEAGLYNGVLMFIEMMYNYITVFTHQWKFAMKGLSQAEILKYKRKQDEDNAAGTGESGKPSISKDTMCTENIKEVARSMREVFDSWSSRNTYEDKVLTETPKGYPDKLYSSLVGAAYVHEMGGGAVLGRCMLQVRSVGGWGDCHCAFWYKLALSVVLWCPY